MNEKVLRTLEYNKIIGMLAERANSDPGRKLCMELRPFTDITVINEAQQQTADALSRLFKKGSTSFGGNKDGLHPEILKRRFLPVHSGAAENRRNAGKCQPGKILRKT